MAEFSELLGGGVGVLRTDAFGKALVTAPHGFNNFFWLHRPLFSWIWASGHHGPDGKNHHIVEASAFTFKYIN
jgi:hypothetical protein